MKACDAPGPTVKRDEAVAPREPHTVASAEVVAPIDISEDVRELPDQLEAGEISIQQSIGSIECPRQNMRRPREREGCGGSLYWS